MLQRFHVARLLIPRFGADKSIFRVNQQGFQKTAKFGHSRLSAQPCHYDKPLVQRVKVDGPPEEFVAEAPTEAAAPAAEARGSSDSTVSVAVATATTAASFDDGDCCVVCLDSAKTHLFVPCGHQCVCAGCAASIMALRPRSSRQCPICRAQAKSMLRVYR